MRLLPKSVHYVYCHEYSPRRRNVGMSFVGVVCTIGPVSIGSAPCVGNRFVHRPFFPCTITNKISFGVKYADASTPLAVQVAGHVYNSAIHASTSIAMAETR
jgi:hypothetical protein